MSLAQTKIHRHRPQIAKNKRIIGHLQDSYGCQSRKNAPASASQNSTYTSTPNGLTPSTLPSISPAPQTTPQTAPQHSTSTSTQTACAGPCHQSCKHAHPNCTPPSTQQSILQITFSSLLEVRTPIAFSYLGNNPKTACPR